MAKRRGMEGLWVFNKKRKRQIVRLDMKTSGGENHELWTK